MPFNKNISRKGFTMIELLLSIALIGIAISVLLISINPRSLFQKTRDVQRFNDLQSISVVLTTLMKEEPNIYFGDQNSIYISLLSNSATCTDYMLPIITTSYQYKCSSNPENVDGTGWIPVDLTLNPIIGLRKLPIDPINEPPYFYAYRIKNKLIKLTAHFENTQNMQSSYLDGGNDPALYEIGEDLSLIVPENGLTFVYHFEKASGTVAYDDSGFNFTADLFNFNFTTSSGWANGKLGFGLAFDGIDDYLRSNYALQTNELQEFTNCFWFISTSTANQTLFTFGASSYFAITLENGSVKFYTRGKDASSDILSADTYNDGQWHFICGWYQATSNPNKKIFIDGKEVAQALAHNQNSLGDNTQKFAEIGRELNGINYFEGKIDEVYFYQKAIQQDEIRMLYYLTR